MRILLTWVITIAIGLALILLRALDIITWDWWLVLIPFWVPAILYMALAITLVGWYLITGGSKNK